MFKLKASILLFLVILLNALAIYRAIDTRRGKAEARISADLRRAKLQLQRDLRLEELELRNVAALLSRGEIRAYMGVLDRFRDPLYELRKEAYEAVPLTPSEIETQVFDEARTRERSAFVVSREALLDDFTSALADEYGYLKGDAAWSDGRTRAGFVSEQRTKLSECLVGAAGDCAFDFTYYPLARDTARLRRNWSDRIRADLVLVADRSGTGRADADDPRWSDQRHFGDRYPVARAALQGRVYRDLLRFGESPAGYYVVVAAPVRNRDAGRPLGALLVGTQLDSRRAHRAAVELGVDVTLVHGNEVIASTLPKEAHREVVGVSTAVGRTASGRYQTVGLAYRGNFTDNDVRVVLSTDLSIALAGYHSLAFGVIFLAVLILLAALIVLHVLIRGYAKQFELLDAGIHEVISGNENYQFRFDLSDRLASDMAQSLNLMVAVLLGRPLPEESAESSWDEALLIDGEIEGEIDGCGVAGGSAEELTPIGPALEPIGGPRGQELLSEPAEAYYRRLFAEYIDARKAAGEDVAPITYVKFVEKLVRNERRLKERLNCRYVRFELGVRDGAVLLTPIPIG